MTWRECAHWSAGLDGKPSHAQADSVSWLGAPPYQSSISRNGPTLACSMARFLRLWAMRAIAVAQPGYYEAREAARTGTGGGMLLEDAIRQYRAAW